MSGLLTVFRSLRRGWWFGLWGMRPAGRMFLARSGWAAYAVMARNVWHWVFANSFSLTVKGLLWLAFSLCPLPWCLDFDFALIFTAVWAGTFLLLYQLAINGGAPSRLIMRYWVAQKIFGWKLGWRWRSRWPMEWAIGAAKTRAVQAEVGNTSEAAVTIRPVFDAPKLSWWPRIQWPVISWWVSPPPGRTFEQFDAMVDVLASNMANVVAIDLDYERSTSSIGRLSILFDDPLAVPALPDYHVVKPDAVVADIDRDDDDAVDLRPLRLVEQPEQEVV